jgi:hypothetical protein
MSKSIIFVLTLLSALFLFSACGGPEDYELYNTEAYLTESASAAGMCTEDCRGMVCTDTNSRAQNISGNVCRIDSHGDCKGRYSCKCVSDVDGRFTSKSKKFSCDTGAPVKPRGRSVEQSEARDSTDPGAL